MSDTGPEWRGELHKKKSMLPQLLGAKELALVSRNRSRHRQVNFGGPFAGMKRKMGAILPVKNEFHQVLGKKGRTGKRGDVKWW